MPPIKLNPNGPGIYAIVHLSSGRRYIGQAQNIRKRWSVHITMLKKNYHHSPYLQNLWNKYGREEFGFWTVERCNIEVLDQREQYWIDRYPKTILLNTAPIAGNCRGCKQSEEVKIRLSEVQTEIGKNPEERQRRSERAKEQHNKFKLGRWTWKNPKPVKSKICITCGNKWIPEVTPGDLRSQSKYCIDCRPCHIGGRYISTEDWLGKYTPIRICRKCKKEFEPNIVPSGVRSKRKDCYDCDTKPYIRG